MDTTKQREEFEAWFNNEVFSLKLADSKLVNCYWDAWQAAQKAAIASIEIELPERKSADYFADESFSRKDLAAIHNVTVEQCKVRVTAAGLRVKS
ncbi:hypothetical protein [Rouxiella sp. Mn2063]|uniref:hypothetical protein n=1 Tax=Rouxiella sp. Mn2063 TaxID=3395262 RepID=UPI003BC2A349